MLKVSICLFNTFDNICLFTYLPIFCLFEMRLTKVHIVSYIWLCVVLCCIVFVCITLSYMIISHMFGLFGDFVVPNSFDWSDGKK